MGEERRSWGVYKEDKMGVGVSDYAAGYTLLHKEWSLNRDVK